MVMGGFLFLVFFVLIFVVLLFWGLVVGVICVLFVFFVMVMVFSLF